MLLYDNVGAGSEPWSADWTTDDTLLYNLAVGSGPQDLHLVTENSQGIELQALPTFAAVLGGSLRPVKHLVGEFPSHCIVFAGQRVELHATLPAEGRIDVTTSIVSMTDRSTGVVLETAAMARNHADGTPLFTSHSSYFLRGLGSKPMSSGERPALVEQMWGASVTASTRDDQALLYRLCGDRNPLHSDPTFAARAGFGRPILHGLCTWATVARTVIGRVLGSDVGAVAEIDGQFRNPVFPGESIEIDVAQVDECELVYRARVGERVVVDGGRIRTTRGVTL
ncbi:MaoC/PaaZ C-terminal domain-containing protein (plasmid) [Rhodococcus pyridinivorans]|uniref:MaoC/PaaZ C-terminal domain-containing protein n=1 Tax=Rhodococcus TaxID=1827 RepID=UPI0007DA065C|nr:MULTISPECIES: MaoC/PaaZ C-terminal domain-containing protein [Rhodococcus]MCT7293653.1 MaoC/PaaZ C-terminal domain-containing protein [Rhodococcus sp. PAE-6]QXU56437.1 MaoC family dehydratase N-terminal domain-containing protein [Rhodococcus sp. LW-XY12]UQB75806.1 MaoC family dehydratase N-terminal domain-containing protein [Rhodococcus ruber]UVT27494.1 MaoC/PaaZ C-terminal domain-containing protein [Rhodococcus pyridinivorans]WML66343.1 MaoC/PaaZ C-terminal domain-containing protein [Rhodo